MYSALLRIGLIALPLFIALALLCNVCRRGRNGLVRAAAKAPRLSKRPSRFVRELRPRHQDLLVKFVAASSASVGILKVLSAHRKPLPLMTIAREVSVEQDRRRQGHDSATSAVLADGHGTTLLPLPRETKTLAYNAAL